MLADLQSIGTYGWFPSQSVTSKIQAVGTYGWFLDFVTTSDGFDPDKLFLLLCVNTMLELDMER